MTNILEYIDELMDSGLSEEDASRCANVMYGDDGWTDDEDIPEEDIPELCEPEDDEIPSWAKSPDDDMTQDEVLKAYGFGSAKEFEEYENGHEPIRYW